jgi:SpoVK/Ycf46/Vps4 family AAA+-type ATPase
MIPNSEKGPLVDHVKDLRPLTDLVLPASTRAVLDRVLAEHYRATELAARGLRASNRLLFCGPPGCGKTVAAGALALALGLPLAVVRLDAVLGQFLGTTSGHLRQIFDLATHNRIVLFLDEVDALGSARGMQSGDSAGGEIKRVVNALLLMLEEMRGGPSLVVAATNHEGALDPALWRRFDEIAVFPRPAGLEAAALLTKLVRQYDPRVATLSYNLAPWARKLAGMSFADVERVALGAAKAVAMNEALCIEAALAGALEQQRGRAALTATPAKTKAP